MSGMGDNVKTCCNAYFDSSKERIPCMLCKNTQLSLLFSLEEKKGITTKSIKRNQAKKVFWWFCLFFFQTVQQRKLKFVCHNQFTMWRRRKTLTFFSIFLLPKYCKLLYCPLVQRGVRKWAAPAEESELSALSTHLI